MHTGSTGRPMFVMVLLKLADNVTSPPLCCMAARNAHTRAGQTTLNACMYSIHARQRPAVVAPPQHKRTTAWGMYMLQVRVTNC
jgi:hypothetical protein